MLGSFYEYELSKFSQITYWGIFFTLLPLLIKVSHIQQPVVQFFQGPSLLSFSFSSYLDCRFTKKRASLQRQGEWLSETQRYLSWKSTLNILYLSVKCHQPKLKQLSFIILFIEKLPRNLKAYYSAFISKCNQN